MKFRLLDRILTFSLGAQASGLRWGLLNGRLAPAEQPPPDKLAVAPSDIGEPDPFSNVAQNPTLVARKAISFEEFNLLEPWGRRGVFPESLVLQTAVEAAGTLLALLSDFQTFGLLSEVARATFLRQTKPGDVLTITVELQENRPNPAFAFGIATDAGTVAEGAFTLVPLPLSSLVSPDRLRRQLEVLGVQVA